MPTITALKDALTVLNDEAAPLLVPSILLEDAEYTDDPAKRTMITVLTRALNRLAEAERTVAEQRERLNELQAQALTDPLTGIANRRGFRSLFDREVARLSRNPGGVGGALLLCDLDAFKAINDSHGHAAGDACLLAFARCLSRAVRGTDVVGRMGGDEFAILLTEISEENALLRLAAIREAVSEIAIRWNGKSIQLDTSIGMAGYTREECELADLLEIADKALYADKRRRRAQAAPEAVSVQPALALGFGSGGKSSLIESSLSRA